MQRILIIIISFSLALSSCTSSEDNANVIKKANITIITSLNGTGDTGYNDLILSGIMYFYEANDVCLNMITPHRYEDVAPAVEKWQAEATNYSRSLLVLAGSEYEEFVSTNNIELHENQQILLFESKNKNLPAGVNTFYINRYGASYLAGCMAKEHYAATIIAAMPGEALLEEAIAGFGDGYKTHSGKDAELFYLSDNEKGFAMADSAYRLASDISNAFIFPLAGGSNNGIYKYSREASFYLPLIVGMDKDCSMYSDRIPFSMVVNIDKVVEEYLTDWTNNIPLEKSKEFGLGSGIIDIIPSPTFYRNLVIWEDYYDSEDYWQNVYNSHKAEAIEKEKEYEKY